MNILLSNDDGCKSLGLKVLRNALGSFGTVLTVSPHKDISASSSCLSVHRPVKTVMISKKFYKVYGTPADCVHIGSRGILKKTPTSPCSSCFVSQILKPFFARRRL